MDITDHFALQLASSWFFTKHRFLSLLDLLDKLFDSRLVHEDIVGCDTDLSTVKEFTKGDLA